MPTTGTGKTVRAGATVNFVLNAKDAETKAAISIDAADAVTVFLTKPDGSTVAYDKNSTSAVVLVDGPNGQFSWKNPAGFFVGGDAGLWEIEGEIVIAASGDVIRLEPRSFRLAASATAVPQP